MASTYESKLWKMTPLRLERAKENELSRRFYHVLLRWVSFAKEEFTEWDGRPDCGYFFGGNFWYSTETAYPALIFAVAGKLGEYDEQLTGLPRTKAKEMAIKALRYMSFTHDTGPSDCVRVIGPNKYTSGKKWGGEGDNFFMASQNGRTIAVIGITAWLLWDELDNESKEMVQNVIASYADRFCDMEPKNGSYYDTQCEENAWTSAGIGTAMSLFPEHPRFEKWKNGFENWSINTVTTYWDRLTARSGLIEGLSHADIKTINFHPDYTTENHAFVHPSYLCAGINLRAMHAVFSLMGGQPINHCAVYNNETLYEKTVKKWVQSDGLAVPIQGQDWWYNRHHERQLTHTILNVIHHDPEAARLERNCLDVIEKIQRSNSKGCLLEEENHVFNAEHSQSSKDFEPGSALDLVHSYLLHLFGGIGAEPVTDTAFKESKKGVHMYPHGSFVIHRTDDTFTSFSWRNHVMLLNLPKDGLWNVTPLFNSYTGSMKMKKSTPRTSLSNEHVIRRVEKHSLTEYPDGFAASVTVDRGNGAVDQKIAVVSLPNGHSVYMEKITFKESCELEEAYTGNVGIRNENYREMKQLAPGRRTLYLPTEQHEFKGFIGSEPDKVMSWKAEDYVNVDNTIGFLVRGSNGITYKNQHQYEKWKGIEDLLILNGIGSGSFEKGQCLPIFTVVTMPNQAAAETAEERKHTVYLECNDKELQVLTKREYLVYANFKSDSDLVTAAAPLKEDALYLFEGTNVIQNGTYEWTKRLAPEQSGFYKSNWQLDSTHLEDHIEVQIDGDRIVLMNRSDHTVSIKLRNVDSNQVIVKQLPAVSFDIIEHD